MEATTKPVPEPLLPAGDLREAAFSGERLDGPVIPFLLSVRAGTDPTSTFLGYHIRRKATELSIPCYTSIDTAYATVMETHNKTMNVSTVDDYTD